MSISKFVIGGAFVIAAFVSIVPLFKRDLGTYSRESPGNEVIGSYDGIIVKLSDLNDQERQNLFEANSQVYKLKENILGKKYFDFILNKYAKDNKVIDKDNIKGQFVRQNIKVSESDVKSFIQQNKDNPRLRGKTNEEQIALVKPYLLQQVAGFYFRDIVAKAKQDGLIKVTGVQMPVRPRIKIDIGNAPAKGPANAPVTIIEFADFQCQYCYSAESTVRMILDKYKNKVRFVFKNYPLIQLHFQAVNAAIAADCAQKQGKYWEMHDILFKNQAKLTDKAYDSFAKTVGLDLNKFQTCFKDPISKEKVMKDVYYGQRLDINATPAFYINGILLRGAQDMSEFENVIDKELAGKKG